MIAARPEFSRARPGQPGRVYAVCRRRKELFAALHNQITEGAILKPLLSFFFPILLGTFFQQLYNTVDAIIVGNFVGTAALGAVGGPTAVLINFLVNLFVGLSSGATVVIAQYYGARQGEDLREAVHTGIALSLAAGVVITGVGIALSGPVLRMMGTPEDVMGYALTYLRVYFCGTMASFIYNMGSSILRAIGDTKRPLYFLIAACLTNIVLDLFFVVVLDMAVFGVGLATVLSQVVSAVLVAVSLLQPGTVYCVDLRAIRFHPDKLKSILRIGLPAGIQSNMYTISNMVLQSCINSFGTVTVAAWTAFGKVDGFYWMVSGAFGVSITTFVSQNFGARKYDRLKKGVMVCLGVTFGVTALISLLFCGAAPILLRMFTSDSAVIALGRHVMWFTVPFYVTFVCIEIFSGAVRGTGDSLKPMLLTCSGVCVLRVLWVLLVLPHRNVLETVLSGRVPHRKGRLKSEDYDIAGQVLESMDLSRYAMRQLNQLSGGERQRVFIARAVAQRPRVMLLDEPTSNLDMRFQQETMEIVKALSAGRGITVITILHDLNLAIVYADQAVLLRDGTVYRAQSPQEALDGANIRDIFGVEVGFAPLDGARYIVPRRLERG